MQFDEGWLRARPTVLVLAGLVSLVSGCASPGTPRPPSLQLPEVVRDLAASRSGNVVEVRFSVPSRTTDGVAIRSGTATGVLCRQDTPGGPCRVVDAAETANPIAVTPVGYASNEVVWKDVLPPGLADGGHRVLAYKVELRNDLGRSAGYSEAAYASSGAAPPAVDGFEAQGARPGVLLRWNPAAPGAEVLVEREQLDGVPRRGAGEKSGIRTGSGGEERTPGGRRSAGSKRQQDNDRVVWLRAADGAVSTSGMIDGTVEEGVRYRYTAVRSETVRVGGRTLEVRSSPSATVEIAWRDVYPPPAPQGLTALGFVAASGQGAGQAYAVDLVWEPVSDPRVTGYVVMRQRVDASGNPVGTPEKLTAEPISTPGFHDAAAVAADRYRYEVTAVDARGNVSAPAVARVDPAS